MDPSGPSRCDAAGSGRCSSRPQRTVYNDGLPRIYQCLNVWHASDHDVLNMFSRIFFRLLVMIGIWTTVLCQAHEESDMVHG